MSAAARPDMIRNACPSLAAPMATGDGLLVRLKPLPSGLSGGQWLALASAAQAHGNGRLEISSRGNIQIRGLQANSVLPLATAITAADIKIAAGPAIDCPPLSNTDHSGRSAITTLAEHLRSAIVSADLGHRLAAKTSIVIEGDSPFTLADLIADLRLCKNAGGWQVSVGGNRRRGKIIGQVSDEAALPVALKLLTCIAARGPHARGRDLDADDFRALATTGLVPVKTSTMPPMTPTSLGALALPDAAWAVVLQPAFGALDSKSLRQLSTQLAVFGDLRMHPAAGKKLVIEPLAADQVERLIEMAGRFGFIVGDDDRRQQLQICVGAPGCAQAHMDTQAVAQTIADSLNQSARIHVSGCAKACARPAQFDAEILGHAAGVTITGGTAKALPDSLNSLLETALRHACSDRRIM